MHSEDMRGLSEPSVLWKMKSGEKHGSWAAVSRQTIVLLFIKIRNIKGKVEGECLSIAMQNMSVLIEQAILSVSLNPPALSG